MGRVKNKIRVSFCGTNAEDVTGSCILVESSNRTILIECGLYQDSGSTLNQYKINSAKFPFNSKSINYIFLSHQHSDHSMRIPLLYKRGCSGTIVAPEHTLPFFSVMGKDSANIMLRDAEELSREYERDYAPIYTESDVDKAVKHYKEMPVGEIISLDEFVKVRFTPAGHIPFSCQIEIWVTEGNLVKKIAYTGDLGNTLVKQYYCQDFSPIQRADIFIGETTYASSERVASIRSREDDLNKIRSIIEQTCIEDRGRIIFGTFALARCQSILTMLYELYGDNKEFKVPVLIDSNLAIKMCDLYSSLLEGEDAEYWKRVTSWKNIVWISDSATGRQWRDSNQSVIVLSSSGMMTKGAVLRWLVGALPRSQDRIVTCGYAADGSIAAAIKDGGQKRIKISGKYIQNKCQVTQLLSMSSHMQRDQLLNYYASVDCQKLCLVHGEMNGKVQFAQELQDKMSRNDKTARVVCVNKGTEILI